MKIAFLLPTNEIAGGVFVVYRQASYLVNRGHDVSIIYESYEEQWWSKYDIDEKITRIVDFAHAQTEKYDLAIATWWKTAFTVLKLTAKKYAYFVQSDERKFYDEEPRDIDRANRHAVEYTYRLFPGAIITEASWIKDLMFNEFGRLAHLAPNGIDTSIFNTGSTQTEALPEKIRVLVEGPGNVPFKRVEFAHLCLSHFYNEIEIWHIANDGIVRPYWKTDKKFSRVPYKEMPSIMRSCDFIIKLSTVEGFFGPPLEMMACGGTAITSNVSGHDEFMVHERNGLVVPMDDYEATINAIEQVVNGGRQFLRPLKEHAIDTANKFDWKMQHPYFEEAIFSAYSEPPIGDHKKLQIIGELYIRDPLFFLSVYADGK